MRHALSLQRVYNLVSGTGYYRLKAKEYRGEYVKGHLKVRLDQELRSCADVLGHFEEVRANMGYGVLGVIKA